MIIRFLFQIQPWKVLLIPPFRRKSSLRAFCSDWSFLSICLRFTKTSFCSKFTLRAIKKLFNFWPSIMYSLILSSAQKKMENIHRERRFNYYFVISFYYHQFRVRLIYVCGSVFQLVLRILLCLDDLLVYTPPFPNLYWWTLRFYIQLQIWTLNESENCIEI